MYAYLKQDPKAKIKPVFVSAKSKPEVLDMAVWVLEEEDGPKQGTAFAAAGLDLVTAAHVLAKKMLASSPSIPVADASATEITSHEHVDVGRVALKVRIPVYLSPEYTCCNQRRFAP